MHSKSWVLSSISQGIFMRRQEAVLWICWFIPAVIVPACSYFQKQRWNTVMTDSLDSESLKENFEFQIAPLLLFQEVMKLFSARAHKYITSRKYLMDWQAYRLCLPIPYRNSLLKHRAGSPWCSAKSRCWWTAFLFLWLELQTHMTFGFLLVAQSNSDKDFTSLTNLDLII